MSIPANVHRQTIRRGMDYLEATTCVKFVEINQEDILSDPDGKVMIVGGIPGAA